VPPLLVGRLTCIGHVVKDVWA